MLASDDEIVDILRIVCPEDMLDAMGVSANLRWEGTRSWYDWPAKTANIVRQMHGPINDLASEVAVRIVKRPSFNGKRRGETELMLKDYLTKLRAVRNRFARRAWRLFAPLAG
jgi:hypothetical protein